MGVRRHNHTLSWIEQIVEANTQFVHLEKKVWTAQTKVISYFLQQGVQVSASHHSSLNFLTSDYCTKRKKERAEPEEDLCLTFPKMYDSSLHNKVSEENATRNWLSEESPTAEYFSVLTEALRKFKWLEHYSIDKPTLSEDEQIRILIELNKQIALLDRYLSDVHTILAGIAEKEADTPVGHFNPFVKNNKLPAPSDEENKRQRLSIRFAEELAEMLDLTDREMAHILTISIRTYHRLKPDGLLNPVASERLTLLNELAAYGLDVFENQDTFNKWLRLPLQELSNLSPLNSLDTATGFNLVKAVLGRIDYGVYS
ncbi:putative toxin-antitoxin system antitoxin component, TIGR02293 family [Spirosoma fluviale]|uniref:Putative toxin-antitoxin system antitoxin component, TIGR02293 family n=2 Tax=Spirosoma fluviale TaxID=1597977 RepID=A0A286FDM1_9BACT|nr:putative toxin-antitoxin system antitoxin component, TIGR02293 family [Spirosoma fluviale]